MNRLIIATSNRGKSIEIKDILSDLNISISDLLDEGINIDIEESVTTYREYSLIKAKRIHGITGLPVVADDSGLEVDALGGRPGIHSARYANTTESRIGKLLNEMKGVEERFRTARFVCVACLYIGNEEYYFFEGKVEGIIIDSPRGSNGFGFDPVFFVPRYKKTMAELPPQIKNRISHRSNAFLQLKNFLVNYWQ